MIKLEDILVLILILLVPIFIGIYFGYTQKIKKFFRISIGEEKAALSEYLVASSEMGAIPIAFSLFATFVSTTTLLGAPAEVYMNGIQYWIVSFGFFITPLAGIFITGPFFLKIKANSVFEYFDLRFKSKNVRRLGMVCYVLGTIFATGLYIYGPASALNKIINIKEFTSIALIGTIATFYTAIGGIKAVIWTDFYQTIIMIICLLIIVCKGLYDIGGFDNMWQINLYGERLQLFDFNPDPFIRQSFWSQTIGWVFGLSLFYSVDQQLIQRFIASRNTKTAQKALIYHMPLIFSFFTLVCLCGLVLYANFFTCDLLLDNRITNQNQLMGYFVSNNLKSWPGMTGLFLGALFCASFSSISSTLSSLSSIIWQDFCMLIPKFQKLNDSKSAFTTKLLVFICGFVSTLLAFFFAAIKGNLIVLSSSLQGAIKSPIMAVFILGAFFKFTNKIGVIVGIVFGFISGLWLSLGANLVLPNYPKLSRSTEFCNYTNMSTFDIYETMLKETIIKTNKYNSTIFAQGERATNLKGFDVFYSMSYMYTFLFSLIVNLVTGSIASIIVNLFGKENDVDDSYIIYDLCRIFKKKNKVNNEQDLEEMCKKRIEKKYSIETSDNECLNL